MTIDWRQSAVRAGHAARVGAANRFVAATPMPDVSPIDSFYEASTEILRVADPTFLAQHPTMGALLLVGIVSATENYFRDIFARAISMCPMCKEAAAQQSINLGTVMWHGGTIPERGVFEHLSLASADGVRSTAKKFLGIEIRRNGQTDVALGEFDKVCELRHCIVHCGSVFSGKNALRLQLANIGPRARIQIDFAELQECADVCTTLVVAANQDLFVLLGERWAKDWRRHGTWVDSDSHSRFRAIWNTFASTRDAASGQIPVPLTPLKCRNAIKKEFRVT